MQNIVIGTGAIRTGKTSLSVLLHECDGANVLHERMRLRPDPKEIHFRREIQRIRDREGRYVGSVSFQWLPYLGMLREKTDASIVGLVREMDSFVESCMEKASDAWFRVRSRRTPTFDEKNKEKAWRRYQEYSREQFEKHDVPTFWTSGLSQKDTQHSILDVAGIAEKDRQTHSSLQYRTREKDAGGPHQ